MIYPIQDCGCKNNFGRGNEAQIETDFRSHKEIHFITYVETMRYFEGIRFESNVAKSEVGMK